MKRRQFLQSVAAIAAGLAVPISVRGFQGPLCSDQELILWLESNFHCSVGAPWAFVEPRPLWTESLAGINNDPRWNTLTPYITLKAEDYDSPAKIILSEFKSILAEHPQIRGTQLFWRFPEKIKVSESWYQNRGTCLLTSEQFEDGGNGWPTMEQAADMTPTIRAALDTVIETNDAYAQVPGCVGTAAEGAIYTAVGEPWPVRSVRVRLAIPALQALAKDSGITLPASYEASGKLNIRHANIANISTFRLQ